jgi:hypothetical protein
MTWFGATTAISAIESGSPAARMATRGFPSIFEAWNPVENLDTGASGNVVPLASVESPLDSMARHDLVFVVWNGLGLRSEERSVLTTHFAEDSVRNALATRATLLARNPHIILLASLTYRNANIERSGIPEDSPFWKRDAAGQRISTAGIAKAGQQYFLDFARPDLQEAVAAQCRALIMTGVFDGCMMDWWGERIATDPVDPNGDHRVELIKRIRSAIGDDAILIGNTNDRIPEATAPYLNGMFMEGFGARYFSDWKKAASDLIWAQTHLKRPVITALEGWYLTTGRNDFARMREITTLALTHSNGYALFADPNSPTTTNHAHDWYPFWDKSLGRPQQSIGQSGPSGSFRREFERGTVIFNPPNNAAVHVHFKDIRKSAATGQSGRDFEVQAEDGDIFVREP